MNTNEIQLLKKLGEETIYTAKGHFKSCDIRRQLITYTIWGCIFLNVIGIIGFGEIIDKYLSAIGLFGTIALLLWNEGEGKNYRLSHKKVGERYLAIHKEIRKLYFSNNFSSDELKKINEKVIELDTSEKPEIPLLARRLAKKAIESNDPETDNWFK